MNFAAWVLITYGAFTLVGGLIGYLKAKSLPSVLAGGAAAGIEFACAMEAFKGNAQALLVGGGVAALLGARFGWTWSKNRRVMPDLLMVMLSLLAAGAVLYGLYA